MIHFKIIRLILLHVNINEMWFFYKNNNIFQNKTFGENSDIVLLFGNCFNVWLKKDSQILLSIL